MSNTILTPANPPISIIPFTYVDNKIDVSWEKDEVTLSINGPDLVISTNDGRKLFLTMGAKLASLHEGLFSLSFNDGKKLYSQEILSLAQVEHTSPDLVETDSPDKLYVQNTPNEDEQSSTENSKDNNTDTSLEMQEEVIIISNSGAADPADSDIESPVDDINISTDIVLRKINAADSTPTLRKSSNPVTSSSDTDNGPNVDTTPPTGNVAPEAPKVKLYQWEGLRDGASHIADAGSGSQAARTSADSSTQYANTTIDLSVESANWTINASNTNYMPDGKVIRIISFDDAANISSITGLPAGYQIIQGGTAAGNQYGLQPNEVLIIYPQDQVNKFSLAVTYVDGNGATKTESFNFSVVDNPSSIVDIDNNIQLSTKPNNVHVIGGSGNDLIVAGNTNDIYDGGLGNNTVDYHNVNGDLTIDLHTGIVSGSVNQELKNIQNVTGNDGNNTFIGSLTESNRFTGGAGHDLFIVGGGTTNHIDGQGGVNTISYETVTNSIHVDLTAGTVTDSTGRNDTVTNVQNIIGTKYNDILMGNADDNTITGNGGDDVLIGMGGNNTLIGGNGNSTASYEYATSGITADLRQTSHQVSNNGFGGQDTLTRIQTLKGSQFNDHFTTGNGSITIYGGAGNDTFVVGGDTASRAVIYGESGNNTYIAGQGYNRYIGGTGTDIVDYSQAMSGIEVNLKSERAYVNGFGSVDQLINIDGIVGSAFDDQIELADRNYIINAGGGNDYIIVGNGGMTNQYDGGTGVNTLDYSNVSHGIDVSLQNNVATKNGVIQSGVNGQDIITNIQNIIGSAHNDVIEGNAENNVINLGGGTNNTVYGSAGSDTIIAQANGTNTLDYSRYNDSTLSVQINAATGIVTKGSGKTDIFTAGSFTKFVGSSGNDIFTINAKTTSVDGYAGRDKLILGTDMTGSYTINLNAQTITGSSTISLHNIHDVQGTSGTYTILGSLTEDNIIIGGTKNDVFRGNGGNNTITGGGGTDWVYYDTGTMGVTVTLNASGNGTATNGYGGTDTLTGISHIRGSQYNDVLTGAKAIFGGAGDNILTGVGSSAFAYYTSVTTTQGIVADLQTGIVSNNGYGGTDTLINIHTIYGSKNNDVITGSSTKDTIRTGAGNDIVFGSTGNDTIINDSGTTTLNYSLISNSITVDLATGSVSKGTGGTDKITSITNLIGSNQNDNFKFSSFANLSQYSSIDGGAGQDTITKQGGSSGIFDFSELSSTLFKHIDIFNFKDGVQGDFIIVNISDLFTNMDNNYIQFITDSTDALQINTSMGSWVHTEISPGVDQWTDGTNTLVWNHV